MSNAIVDKMDETVDKMDNNVQAPSRIETVVTALRSLGGQARPFDIANEIRRIYPGPHTANLLQSVRGRIQECSSDSLHWKKKRDLFYSVHGIGGGVWGLREMDTLEPNNIDGFVDPAETYIAQEGAAILRTHLRRERSKKLVSLFKDQLIDMSCSVCNFDFEKVYGDIGSGFIEAHHIVPVAQLEPGDKTQISDLVAVCSNCHRMLHRSGCVAVADLKSWLQRSDIK